MKKLQWPGVHDRHHYVLQAALEQAAGTLGAERLWPWGHGRERGPTFTIRPQTDSGCLKELSNLKSVAKEEDLLKIDVNIYLNSGMRPTQKFQWERALD